MTREEAIKIIDCYDIGFYDLSGEKIPADKLAKAFDMAIDALQTDAVSREAHYDAVANRITDMEERGFVQVVRCKDCKHKYMDGEVTHYYWCRLHDRPVDDTDYCSWGEESEVEG